MWPGDGAGGTAAAALAGQGGEQEAVEQLQQEVVRLQEERARVARLRLDLEEAAARLDQERAAFEKRKVGRPQGGCWVGWLPARRRPPHARMVEVLRASGGAPT